MNERALAGILGNGAFGITGYGIREDRKRWDWTIKSFEMMS